MVKTLGKAESAWICCLHLQLSSSSFLSKPFPAWALHFLQDGECREAGREGINTFNSPPFPQTAVSEAEINAFTNTGMHKVLNLSTSSSKSQICSWQTASSCWKYTVRIRKSSQKTAKPGKARAERQLCQELITVETCGAAEPPGADKVGTPRG